MQSCIADGTAIKSYIIHNCGNFFQSKIHCKKEWVRNIYWLLRCQVWRQREASEAGWVLMAGIDSRFLLIYWPLGEIGQS